MNGFIALLADSSVRIAVVAVAVAIIVWVARLRSGAMRHTIWTGTMLVMLAMPGLVQVVPETGLPVLEGPPPARPAEAVSPPASVSPPVIVEMPATDAIPALELQPTTPARPVDWIAVLTGIYATGVLLLLLRLAAGWWGTRRLLRSAETATLGGTDVLVSDAVATAVVCGVFRPRIVVPGEWREWPRAKLAMVLAHENAHIRRRDPLVGFIGRLNCALFWFHPVAWWLERRILASAEQACDDAAVSQMREPEAYAELLVSIADGVRSSGGRVAWDAIGMAGRGMLAGRVERLLRGDATKATSAVRKAVVVVLCGGCVYLGASCTAKEGSQSASAKSIEWERITLPFDETMPPLLQIVWLYDPATRSTFVGANGKGLFESKDGGESWTRVDDGTFKVSSVNTDAYTLQSGPGGVLYSIDIVSGVYRSDDAGKHWTMAFPMNGIKGRVWIDPDRPANISLMVTRVTESEPGEIYIQFKRSTNAGVSFEAVDVPGNAGSVDVAGNLICYAIETTVRCSENAKTWQSLSLASLEKYILSDKEINVGVEIAINKANRELLIMSGGKLFETRNGRTVIVPAVDEGKNLGSTNDLPFDSRLTFPAYGVSRIDANSPPKLTRILASGEVESYAGPNAGPKSDWFRLKSVDFAHDTVFVWTSEGYYRGVLK